MKATPSTARHLIELAESIKGDKAMNDDATRAAAVTLCVGAREMLVALLERELRESRSRRSRVGSQENTSGSDDQQ